MIVGIEEFLDTRELEFLRQLYGSLPTRSGDASAGESLSSAKNNLELELGGRVDEVREVVYAACGRAPSLSMIILPKIVTAPILSRYDAGMRYGPHIDAAFGQDDGETYRTDFSCTIFLDDPTTYGGGELNIETDVGAQSYKLPAGGAVFYPTLYDHQVLPVTHGVRRACVFWVESLIRDPLKRQILLDIVQVSDWFGQNEAIDSQVRRSIIRARENLFRMWLGS